MENIFDEQNEPKIPNFNENERWAREKLNKILTELSEEKENKNSDSNFAKEVLKNSVGNQKIKKIVQKTLLALALIGSLTVAGQTILTNLKIENIKELYVEDISQYKEDDMHSSYIVSYYDFDSMAEELAQNIINKSADEGFNPNIEVIKGIGLIIDEVIESSNYTFNNSVTEDDKIVLENKWGEQIYSIVRSRLSEAKIIDLPLEFSKFLEKNGFGEKRNIFNPINGNIYENKDVETNNKDMVRNLVAYAKYISLQQDNTKGGR